MVCLPLASKVQALCAVVPERHADTRDRVENLETTDRLSGIAGVPQTQLTVTHAGETCGRDAAGLTHPNSTAVLCARVAGNLLGRLLLANIPYAQLLVSAGCNELGTVGAPGQRLHNVVVLKGELSLAGFDVPEFDGVVTRRTGEDAFGGGVEEDVTDFPEEL